jgi:hypothetical protein
MDLSVNGSASVDVRHLLRASDVVSIDEGDNLLTLVKSLISAKLGDIAATMCQKVYEEHAQHSVH